MSASDKKKLRKEQEAATLTEKQLTQKKEDKQLKTYTLTFTVVMILVVAIALGSMGFSWYNNSGIPARSTTALTVGEYELSNAELNYYFIDAVNAFYNDVYEAYSTYTTLYVQMYYGLDMTQPLNAQYYNQTTGETWADYFLNDAITYAEATYALYSKAMEAGFELSEEDETYLNAALASTTAQAGLAGYDTLDAYLKAYYGNGADEDSYVNYYRVNAIADAYYTAHADSLTYTQEQIDTYNTEHFDEFSSFDYSYYYVNIKNFLPEGVELTAATEDQREAARAAAETAANELAEATDLEILNKFINQKNIDGSSTAAATEINMTGIGSVATLYSEWIADPARVENETTVVQFESESDNDELVDGYYVVLFEGRKDYSELMRSVRHILVGFEGGTESTDEDGNTVTVYTDEEKQTAYAAAEALYNEWKSGEATEDSFAALATSENSDDTGSNTNGGLYEDVYEGMMLETFNDWLFDETRQVGDTGIVETKHGYHIMYYVGEQEQSYRDYCVELTLRNADIGVWYNELLEQVTSTKGNTDYIYKGLVLASGSTSLS